MDTYKVVIDSAMITNALETDTHEASDLVSLTMFIYLFLLGIIPAILVYRAKITYKPFKQELLARAKLVGAILVTVLGLLLAQSDSAASFFREHKPIRFHSNPAHYIYSVSKLAGSVIHGAELDRQIELLVQDAKLPKDDNHRELIIMVVGETARADRFSLNGYSRKTNPLLEQQDLVSFTNFYSCGTYTGLSVPCMFAIEHSGGFNVDEAQFKQNSLDVLKLSGVEVLWRDNNSSSKHVADRVVFQDYRDSTNNTICDEECRDVGMLVGLQEYIDSKKKGDILIILHQMGSHGPAYYKRYPKEFEKFTPACQTNELSDCTSEEINNAFDNTILYTDYFLNETIELLKRNSEFEAAMVYVSDHGESLGENGIYLHGMPNFMAPKEQRHVPAIIWFGDGFADANIQDLRAKKDVAYTHDNIFNTLLGLMEIEAKEYDVKMDILRN